MAAPQAPGVTTTWFEGGGFLAVADEWVERLQKERGEEYAEQHFADIYGPEGRFAKGTLRAAELRGRP